MSAVLPARCATRSRTRHSGVAGAMRSSVASGSFTYESHDSEADISVDSGMIDVGHAATV